MFCACIYVCVRVLFVFSFVQHKKESSLSLRLFCVLALTFVFQPCFFSPTWSWGFRKRKTGKKAKQHPYPPPPRTPSTPTRGRPPAVRWRKAKAPQQACARQAEEEQVAVLTHQGAVGRRARACVVGG